MSDRPDMFTVQNEVLLLAIAANHQEPRRTLAVMLGGHVATLTAQESLDLLQWLYEQRDALTQLARQSEPEPSEHELPSWITEPTFKCLVAECNNRVGTDAGYCDEHIKQLYKPLQEG